MPEVEVEILPGHALPGFPSGHGPGIYLVDYEERSIRPKPIEVADTPPEQETASESHPDANNVVSNGGVIESANLFFLGGRSPELMVVPAIEHATQEAETTPSTEAQQPMEVVAEPLPSVPTEGQATQPEQE